MTKSTSESVTSDEPVTQPKAGLLIGVLVVSAFVMILNETILSVALRDLSVELGVTTTTVQWLTSGFLLTMAVVIPTTGFLLERYTPRQLFLTSLALFALGTLVSGLAPGFEVLLAGRVIQAAGTAVMIPLLMTTVMRLIPAERRGATMGTIMIVIAVAPAIGPTIGGGLLAALGWRWMFFTVLPLVVVALVIGLVWLHMDSETRHVPLDLFSVLLSAVGFGGLLYGLSSFGESGGGEQAVPPWLPLALGVAGVGVFVWRQLRLQRDDRALLDLRPLSRRSFVVGVVLMALLFMCLLGAGAIMLPLFLQIVLGTNTFISGLAMLPGGLLLGLMGRPVGRLYDRFGARPLVIPGSLALATSMWLFTSLGANTSVVTVVGIHLVLMAGLGLMMTPVMTDSLSALPDHLYSHGSAILTTLQQIAGALGTALFVTVAALGSASYSGTPDEAGLRAAFMTAGVVGVLTVLTALTTRRRPAAPEATAATPNRETSGAAGVH